jgi:hypothetical protein
MSDDKYQGIIGFVFKEPDTSTTREGSPLRRVLVSEANSRNSFYSVTVWEGHAHVPIAAGDLVSAQGKYTEQTKDGRLFKNISARQFVNLGTGNGKEEQSTGTQQAMPVPEEDDLPF